MDILVGGGGLVVLVNAELSGIGHGVLLKDAVDAGRQGVTQNIWGGFESDSLFVQILVYRGA